MSYNPGDRLGCDNTVTGETVEVEVVAYYENPSGACGAPECCGSKIDEYDSRTVK